MRSPGWRQAAEKSSSRETSHDQQLADRLWPGHRRHQSGFRGARRLADGRLRRRRLERQRWFQWRRRHVVLQQLVKQLVVEQFFFQQFVEQLFEQFFQQLQLQLQLQFQFQFLQ